MARTIHERADAVALVAEVFRELGYEGASLNAITLRTGLGKGSLYHFFPGGKEEMARAVLADIDDWFETQVYASLRQGDPKRAVEDMWRAVDSYFRSGGRVCLVGAFALDNTRDVFGAAIRSYFQRWVAALAEALRRDGCATGQARDLAEEAVYGIQGALVLARALDEPGVFTRGMARMSRRLAAGSAAARRGSRETGKPVKRKGTRPEV